MKNFVSLWEKTEWIIIILFCLSCCKEIIARFALNFSRKSLVFVILVIHESQIQMSRLGKLTSNTDKMSTNMLFTATSFIKRTCPDVLLLHTMQDFTRLTGVAAFISSYFPAIFVYISGKVVRTKHTMRDVTQVDVRIT